MTKTLRGLPTLLVGMLLIAVLFTAYTAQQAVATHEPANKTAAAGSDLNEFGPGQRVELMRDQIRVSTAQDAIVSVTSECSILTSLLTGDDEQSVDSDGAGPGEAMRAQDSAFSFGQVEIWVELDGKKIPVALDDGTGLDGDGTNEDADADGNEQGEVVFCNRAYQRTVQDDVEDDDEGCEDSDPTTDDDDGDEVQECEGDLDKERDYINTRTANAFNWLAANIGDEQTNGGYDDLANGNNIIDVIVYAEFDTAVAEEGSSIANPSSCPTTPGQEVTCAQAYVGSRTLIVEPTNVAIHEAVGKTDGFGN